MRNDLEEFVFRSTVLFAVLSVFLEFDISGEFLLEFLACEMQFAARALQLSGCLVDMDPTIFSLLGSDTNLPRGFFFFSATREYVFL